MKATSSSVSNDDRTIITRSTQL